MNNSPFGYNIPQSGNQQMITPNNSNFRPMPLMRCGADKLNIKPRQIDLKPIQPNNNNQPKIVQQQQNPNIHLANNNILQNNINPNTNYNNQPNIPPQWKDFY